MASQIPEEVQWVFEKYTEQMRTAAKAASDIARLEPHMAEHEQRLNEMRAMHADAGRVHTNATGNTKRLRWLLEAACEKARVPLPESPEIPADTQVDLGTFPAAPRTACELGHCDECDDPNCNCPHHTGGTPISEALAAPVRDAEQPAEPEKHSALFGAREPKRIGLITYALTTIGLWLFPPHHGRHVGGAVHA